MCCVCVYILNEKIKANWGMKVNIKDCHNRRNYSVAFGSSWYSSVSHTQKKTSAQPSDTFVKENIVQ